jgi:serine/threonine protein kinase
MKVIHHSVVPRAQFESECAIQSRLTHPYIMPLTDWFDFQGFRAIVMPRATGGTLVDAVSSGRLCDPVAMGKTIYRLCKAVLAMHSHFILHGDIKPANVVLTGDREPHPMIIDFGHAVELADGAECTCRLMTCAYSAPELLGLHGHSFPSDIWALGATIYFMVTGEELLRTTNIETMCELAQALRLRFDGPAWKKYPVSLQALLAGMLRAQPGNRMTIEECLAHQFFKDLLGAAWIATEDEELKKIAAPLKTEHAIANQWNAVF